MMSAYTLPTARTNSGSKGKKNSAGWVRESRACTLHLVIDAKLTILGATKAAARVKIKIEVLEEIYQAR